MQYFDVFPYSRFNEMDQRNIHEYKLIFKHYYIDPEGNAYVEYSRSFLVQHMLTAVRFFSRYLCKLFPRPNRRPNAVLELAVYRGVDVLPTLVIFEERL